MHRVSAASSFGQARRRARRVGARYKVPLIPQGRRSKSKTAVIRVV